MSGSPRSADTRRWLQFLLYVLEPHRASGGWIRATDMAKDLGISRATAYRYIAKAEMAGLPIQRDGKQAGGLLGAGFRCMLQTQQRPADTVPLADRRRLRSGGGKKRAEAAA